MKKIIAIIGLVIGISALLLNFSLSIPNSMETGRSLAMSVIRFFSFFTILTNSALVLVYAAALLPKVGWLSVFRTPLARTTAAACITLVGLFYYVILSGLWQPEGLSLLADVALHYVTPTVYVLWFSLFHRTGTMNFSRIPLMLALPVIYLIYVMIRGAIIGEYPYPTFAANDIGYGLVAINIGALVVFLSLLSAIAIGIERFKPNAKSLK